MSRKEEIIRETLRLASEKGLGAVSMQQIADRVGITKASLYSHFESKNQIVCEMYNYLRERSRRNTGAANADHGALIGSRSLYEILKMSVDSYRKMCTDPDMYMFYSVIMSERSRNKEAAGLMAAETETMIQATRSLFYALQAKKKVDIGDIDAVAFSFAMAVHSIIDYELDLKMSGAQEDSGAMETCIREFCRVYGKEGE